MLKLNSISGRFIALAFVCLASLVGHAQTFTLTITVTGGGVVTDSTSAIHCPGTCSASYASGANVLLTATPHSGNSFTGWTGPFGSPCAGTGTCNVVMTQNWAVTAPFAGGLNASHSYAVALSYSLRNSRGSQKSPGDQGETNGSAATTISGVTSISVTAPGLPLDAAAGVAPVAGQNIPNSNCSIGNKATRCVIPTGYNVFVCDRTAVPGCTPVRAQLDQAPASATGFSCTPASGNSGATYTYIYSVTVRHLNGTALDFGSQNVTATCMTANPISSANPNALSWTPPTSSASLLYDIDRGSTPSTVVENLIGRVACPASPCTFSDASIGNVSGEEEMVSGATTAVSISALPAAGSSAVYSGIQGTGGASTHNMKMDMSGNPVIPGPTAITNNLGFPIADWQWYPDATASCNSVFQSCPYDTKKVFYCPTLCPGHRVSGNGGQIRNPANTSNIQFVLAAPIESKNIISIVNDSMCAGNKCQGAQHDNWSLGINSFANYPMATTYTAGTVYGSTSWPKQLYTGEAIFMPSGDSRVSSAVTSISQTVNTVTATLANSVGCINNVFTLCFAPGMQINTTSIPTGVSHATNWNGQHTLATVNVGSNQITWTSGTSVSDTAGSGGSLNGCGGGALLTGGALSNPNCFAIREGMLYSNGNEATRFYGTPRGFISQVGASSPLIFASSAYTYWNEAATHFNQAPTSLARVSGTVTATFASTATLSASAKAISVTGTATGVNSSSFKGEFPIASTTGTTITWLQPGVDDSVTPTAGACNGAGTATCVDASDSYCFGSSLGDEFGAPDINMNTATQAGCRVDIIVVEPR